MEYVIEVSDLQMNFGQTTALKNVSFNVKKGETIGLLGPSGSGKTTTIKLLTSQLQPTAGKIRVFGNPLMKQKEPSFLKKIGILTDNSGLYDRLSIEDNLALYCKLYDIGYERIEEVLKEVNLVDKKRTPVQKLSKGMKQRVTLARAIIHKPELLFLDEPTSALDPVNTKHIHKGLRKLNKEGTTIFLTTHDMSEADELCDRVAFLHEGEIKQLGEPQKLKVQKSVSAISLLLADDRVVHVQNNEEGAETICRYMSEGKLVTIHSDEPTLGDLFVEITGGTL